jgi:hypothetical protein
MSDKNPADYVIGPDASIEDADLDEREIYYQDERLSEARAAELGELAAREAREGAAGPPANQPRGATPALFQEHYADPAGTTHSTGWPVITAIRSKSWS